MASVNKVIIIGNLGADPETRYMPSGAAVTMIRVATTESWKNKSGEKEEHTEWHRVSFFNRLAEIAGEYLKKGSPVYIEGRLRTRSWEKDGETKYSTEIIADRMQLLGGNGGGRREGGSSRPAGNAPATENKGGGKFGGPFDEMDDDIPF